MTRRKGDRRRGRQRSLSRYAGNIMPLGLVAFVIPLPGCAPDQSVMCCSLARNVLLNKAWKGRQAQIISSVFNVCDAKGADLARRAHFLRVGR
jgi:hypothetical protein